MEILMQIVSVAIGFSLIIGSLAGWAVLAIALWQSGYQRERGGAKSRSVAPRLPEAA